MRLHWHQTPMSVTLLHMSMCIHCVLPPCVRPRHPAHTHTNRHTNSFHFALAGPFMGWHTYMLSRPFLLASFFPFLLVATRYACQSAMYASYMSRLPPPERMPNAGALFVCCCFQSAMAVRVQWAVAGAGCGQLVLRSFAARRLTR
uniref:Secreted protein n=1 Tax=Anopheles darlingi TaxID=43151 RepID=A0A2M4DKF5_ANODA